MQHLHIFSEVDDCILAAYQYVKQTGCKVRHFSEDDINGKQFRLGVQCDDHVFMISVHDHQYSKKRDLARLIFKSGVNTVDFINKQLIAFL